ncbi:MAG: hypothetical protein EXS08_01075 [Planctomycetes bacterium]|nr:hypothetical protein [Planctomycetota bacterium]
MADIHNLNDGRIKHRAAFVVPSLLLALSLAGVATRPNLSLGAAEVARTAAELRARECELLAERVAQFDHGGGPGRLERLLGFARRMLPPPLPLLELHGLLRLLAERSGVDLAALEILEPRDVGLEHLDDVATLREVHLEGESELRGLMAASSAFRLLGCPVAVLELDVARAERAGRYRWTLVLGLFESGAVDAYVPAAQGSAFGGQQP